MSTKKLQVAIDGPASAGKSTVAKLIAKQFGYVYCDTGAMYRSITLKVIQEGIKLDDEPKIVSILDNTTIGFEPGQPQQLVFLDHQDVTNQIRSEQVTNSVSTVAALPGVRKNLVDQQRKIASHGGVIMDGRDIGTTVLPNANLKIFLVASVSERAERRFKDNAEKGIHTPLKELAAEIETRDYKDSHRKVSPLIKASDAIEINTTQMSIQDVVTEISKLMKNKLNNG
ncbi:(d)CMP kinase [Nicoliella spurrieriana]|uniref:Cytidylate kinase n=1 Tax=Nicoliella spurrieriana TaxID=2925830 RepID=A0A976X518_9LACO|nr:(d)CMP kinase [Nicoliella spurrieriana]UQS86563.1 (d)CMP kinase [Nicoliella spurrieriana]